MVVSKDLERSNILITNILTQDSALSFSPDDEHFAVLSSVQVRLYQITGAIVL